MRETWWPGSRATHSGRLFRIPHSAFPMHAEASRYLPTFMRLTVNHQRHDVDAAPHETLLAVLRDRLHLTGAKLVCGRGECGACTVLLDETTGDAPMPVYACLTLAAACDGCAVTTVEGLGRPGALHPLQEAFIESDALQCGFCTPGQL